MVSRDKLYELVWAEPMTKVSARFGVSGSYMARVCDMLNVPRPGRGHWTKLELGKADPAPPLPEAADGDPLVWPNDAMSVPKPRPAVRKSRSVPTAPDRSMPKVHPLVSGVKGLFLNSRPMGENGLLRPFKRALPDVSASPEQLDRALLLANALYTAFEEAGHRVALASGSSSRRPSIDEREASGNGQHYDPYPAPWRPDRPTIVQVGDVKVGLVVHEMTENVTVRYVNGAFVRDTPELAARMTRTRRDNWSTTKDLPSGRLRVIAYSPNASVDWSKGWKEGKGEAAGLSVDTIVKAVSGQARALAAKEAEAAHQAEVRRQAWAEEQERWRREDDRRRTAKSFEDSRVALANVIEQWCRVMEIERFFSSAEDQASRLSGDEKALVLERLGLARALLGSQDPLDFLRGWKSPAELYRPQYPDASATDGR
ncbi:hypothetical protein HNP52_000037 [Sphingomonas kyeonggiensis]|uniref:Uncharacterized protein n=1 Tax=Sphingomonas kyeonggiensis TaxID=1268553 RepID=A0A7W7NQP3_9SPHN|nr:hypothetical protein [Sphingomonas kyeonggiensis]MBB4836986.1 hypothetical protein [Sphingomonas kyeonggiensis]